MLRHCRSWPLESRAFLLTLASMSFAERPLPAQRYDITPAAPVAQGVPSNVRSFLVNGMRTTLDDAKSQAQTKADNLGRPLTLVYNDTADLQAAFAELDRLAESSAGGELFNLTYHLLRFGGHFSQLAVDTYNSAGCKLGPLACGALESSADTLYREIRENLAQPGRIVDLHGFSQGSIIVFSALSMLRADAAYRGMNDDSWRALTTERIRVTTYGAGQHWFNIPGVIEFRFTGDPIAVGTQAMDTALNAASAAAVTQAKVTAAPYLADASGSSTPELALPPSATIELRTPFSMDSHSAQSYFAREAEFRAQEIAARTKGDGTAMAAQIAASIQRGDYSDPMHRQLISALSSQGASTATAAELVTQREFSRELLRLDQCGELGAFTLSNFERALLQSQARVNPAAPSSSLPPESPAPTPCEPPAPFNSSSVSASGAIPPPVSRAELPLEDERAQRAFERLRSSNTRQSEETTQRLIADERQRAGSDRLPRERPLDDPAALFDEPLGVIEIGGEEGGTTPSSRLDQVWSDMRTGRSSRHSGRAKGIAVVSALVSSVASPLGALAVRAASEVAIDRKLSPATFIQGLIELGRRESAPLQGSSAAPSQDQGRLSGCITTGLDPDLSPKDRAWELFQRLKATDPTLLGSAAASLSKDEFYDLVQRWGQKPPLPESLRGPLLDAATKAEAACAEQARPKIQ